MVTAFFNRLGNLGVLLIASALLLGGLAGAAVVHHYDRLSAQTVASHQHTDNRGQGRANKKSHIKPGRPNSRPQPGQGPNGPSTLPGRDLQPTG
jgi:hypothetical protein